MHSAFVMKNLGEKKTSVDVFGKKQAHTWTVQNTVDVYSVYAVLQSQKQQQHTKILSD